MKKRTILAGALLVGGTAYAYKKLDDSVNNIPDELKRKKKDYDFTGDYKVITILETLESIVVTPSSDDKVHVGCYENQEYFYEFLDNGENLSIMTRTTTDYLEKLKDLIRRDKHHLEVKIPKDFKGSLVVRSKNGNVNVENLELLDLHTEVENGSLVVKELNVQNNCAINNKNGTINAENISANCVNCVNINGRTIVFNLTSKGNLTVDSRNGIITGLGIVAGERLSISNRNGKIDLEFLEFGTEGSVVNRNGKIDVSLSGEESDYKFTVNTNGETSVKVPEGSEDGKPLYLENRNGSISATVEW